MSASVPFHFDASLVGPRVYLRPGYRTFRQQLDAQPRRPSVAAPAQLQQIADTPSVQPALSICAAPQQIITQQQAQQPTRRVIVVQSAKPAMSNPRIVESVAVTPTATSAHNNDICSPISPPATPNHTEVDTPTLREAVPMSPLVEASLHVAMGQQPCRCVPQGCTHDCCNGNVQNATTRSEDGDASSSNGVSDERATEAGDVAEVSMRGIHPDTTDGASEGGNSAGCMPEVCKPCMPDMADLSPAELSTVRIAQPCKIELKGLPEESACAETLSAAASYFGDVESCYIRAKDGFNTYSAVVHFKKDCSATSFRVAVDAGEMHNVLGNAAAQIGTTRFCPRSLKGMRCRDSCCPYAHNIPVHATRATA